MDRGDRHDQAEDLLKREIVTDLVRLLSGKQQGSPSREHASLVCGIGRACGVDLVEELDEVVLVVEGIAESPQPRLESLTGRLPVDGLGGLTDDVDLIEIQRFEQLAATWEVAVERRHPDTGAPGDLCHRDLSVLLRESSAGDGEDLVTVALGLGPPGRVGGCTGGHGSHCRTVYPETVLTLPDNLSDKCWENIVPATPVALVTGANKGIGLQIAKDLAARDLTVLVGSRELDRGEAAAKSIEGDARAVQLDVTDQSSIAAAAERIRDEFGRLDVLVNNAGISHAATPGRSMEEIVAGRLSAASLDEIRSVFETNVFGVIAVTQAMLPLLREAPAGRVVNVSSSGGSLTLNSDPTNPHRAMFGTYSASKAAANAVTVAFAADLEADGIKVNAACPGFTGTDLNFFRGTRTVEQGAREPVRLALIGPDGPTGTFSNEDGPLPW